MYFENVSKNGNFSEPFHIKLRSLFFFQIVESFSDLVMIDFLNFGSNGQIAASDIHHHHDITSFLPSNLVGKISIDPTKTSTSTSDANYVTSSDIYDDRYLCDTPLVSRTDSCAGIAATKGLVGGAGRNFSGSTIDPSGSSLSTLGVAGPVNGVPHPSFRFAQKVSDVSFNMQDVTNPGQPKLVWNAKFRLNGPDNSVGSDYLPSSMPPIQATDNFAFHKLCSAINTVRTYQLKIEAGGNAPINQTIIMNSRIVKPCSEIDPNVAAQGGGGTYLSSTANSTTTTRLQEIGPRLYSASGGPQSDTAAAVRSSSFATRHVFTTLNKDDGIMLISSHESNKFPAVTSTSFAKTGNLPVGCHKSPTVTIHTPKSLQTQREYQSLISGGGTPPQQRPGMGYAPGAVRAPGMPPQQPGMGYPMGGVRGMYSQQPMMGYPMGGVATRGFF
jgi:hypothetical protein